MPFSTEDKILIKHYRLDKGYGRMRLLQEFPTKGWTAGGLGHLLRKIDETQSIARKVGSGRRKSARTENNIALVNEEVLSQEDHPGTHSTPAEIARSSGISESSVRRIVKLDLGLKPFKKISGQKLSETNIENRVDRASKLLRNLTVERVNKTFFTDEKLFKIDEPLNSQNNRVYAPANQKKSSITEERLYVTKTGFPNSVMVSVGVSKLGKTSIHFVQPGAKINGQYYRENLLAVMIPEMTELSPDFIFQQDGARAHTARATLSYLEENVPEFIPPDMWPPNSPDLNPVDYGIWHELEARVFRVKIRDLDHLKARLVQCWNDFPQEHIDNAINAFRRRLRKVIDMGGEHIEHVL